MLYLWMPERSAFHPSGDGGGVQDIFRWRVSREVSKSNDLVVGWQTAVGWDALLAATAPEAQSEVVVFFPTSSVQMLNQPMTRQQLRQIGTEGVRYLLEEFSLTPIDQLDVRYQLRDNLLTVLAKPQHDVATLLSALGLMPWRVVGLLPDFLLLPLTPGRATLFLDGHNRILRLDESYAVSADHLDITLARLSQVKEIQVIGELTEADRVILDAQKNISGLDWNLLETPISEVFSVDQKVTKHAYNLVTNVQESSLSSYWKVVIAVFVAVIAVQMIYDAVRIWRYHAVEIATKAQIEQQYRQWFPDEHRILNIKRQMQAHLVGAGGVDMTALTLLSQVGPVLSQANLPAKKIHFTSSSAEGAKTGQLELQINASSLPALESLRTQIAAQGLVAELGSANSASGKSAGPNQATSGQVSGIIRVKQ
ncbi:type II secretion system protein GspL [Aquirhabdus parva]|uniref:Type II secretion system protein L n=1 Tax=Aquirhabdus parva TaxID=2283318 RepID=A0A345P5J8_9GAMM|nr:type II secretion system protein GspL [Aquirhabdus parva]AXI02557.1 hypothetical protein HYN46_06780 [Aquirhabdus parva]